MRTIDADDFLKQSTELYEHAGWDEREVHFSLADLRCNLEMMPTVKAIPVEYIESTMNRWKEIIGYEESVDALRILIDNWKVERTEE